MSDSDITNEHDAIERHDLDPDMVVRILERINDKREDDRTVADDLMEVLDIDEADAYDIVRDWREPDWPITVTKYLKYHSQDQYNDWKYDFRGYNPQQEIFPRQIKVTWEVDKNENGVYTDFSVNLVEVEGHDLTEDDT